MLRQPAHDVIITHHALSQQGRGQRSVLYHSVFYVNGRDIGAKRGQRLVPQRRLRFDPSGREQVHRVENSRKAPAAELLKQPGRQGC